jgi:hypothetical protein
MARRYPFHATRMHPNRSDGYYYEKARPHLDLAHVRAFVR